MEVAERSFVDVAKSFGYTLVRVSPLAFAADFESFGSAASGRMFDFVDRGGRHVTLTANAMLAILRAATGAGAFRRAGPVSMAGCVGVARHRHRPLRGWTQLVATTCNQPDELAAILTMLRLWDAVLVGSGCAVQIRDLGVIDVLAGKEGADGETAREAVHRARKGIDRQGLGPSLLARLDRLAKIDSDQPVENQFAEVVATEGGLAERVGLIERVLVLAATLSLPCQLVWDWSGSLEYRTGLCFEVTAPSGFVVAEGGGYHCKVAPLGIGVTTCWSSAGSTERVAALLPTPRAEIVHLFQQGQVSDAFFLEVAELLRSDGYQVHERWRVSSLRKELRRLPVAEQVQFAVVGGREHESRLVTLRRTTGDPTQRETSLPVPIRSMRG